MAGSVNSACTSAQGSFYLSNAFRVLGRSVDASSRDIRRRSEDLRLRLELDRSDPDKLEEIRSATTLLEDPIRRLTEELYWVHLCPNPIPLQLDPANLTAIWEFTERLKPLVQSGNDEALHDLAVLTHMATIAGDSTDLHLWKEALLRWRQVWASDVFWLRMQTRAEAIADPRVTDETVATLRADLPNQVLKPSATVAGRLLDGSQDKEAAGHLGLLQQSEFPPEAVAKACSYATLSLRTRLKAAIEELQAKLAEAQGESEPSVVGGILSSTWDKSQEQVVLLVKMLKAVYPEGSEIQVAADEAAEFLIALSIRLHNEAKDSETALAVAVAARKAASSESIKQRAGQAVQILRYQVAFKRAMAHAEAKLWMEAAASAKEAKEQTVDPEEQRQLDLFITRCILEAKASGQSTFRAPVTASRPGERTTGHSSDNQAQNHPSPPSPSDHRRSNPIVTGVKIVVALIFGLWLLSYFVSAGGGKSNPSATTGTKSTSPTPTVVRSSSSSSSGTGGVGSASKQALINRLDSLKRDLDDQESTIEQEQSRLRSAEVNLDSMQSRLDSMESQYRSTGAPSYVMSQYESLRSQYNSAVDDYNINLSRVRRMIADFNADVDEYNRLLLQLKGMK